MEQRLRIIPRAGVIYAAAKDLNTSREGLSRRMGVSSSSAFKVERGDVDPSPGFIAALMHVSGKPFEDLFEVVGADAA